VRRVLDGRLQTSIGNVAAFAAFEVVVAALTRAERISGSDVTCVRR
jgi:hypothetical protein